MIREGESKVRKEVLWFNHWFSTAYRIIELIREGAEKDNIDLKIVGTNERKTCVYSKKCDYFYSEPVFKNEDDYVDWCLQFCKGKGITIFAPRRNAPAIVRNKDKFDKIGVKLMTCSDTALMDMLNNKGATFSFFEDNSIARVPKAYICNTAEEFKSAYNQLRKDYRVCFKFSSDEGASSFRVIDNRMNDFKSLYATQGTKITEAQAFTLVDSIEGNFDKPLMVMPYLAGPELSVDCIATDTGIVAVQRKKEGRVTEVTLPDEEVMNVVEKFVKLTNYDSAFNIQFRYHEGVLYLLEVNTRMSGGVHISSMLQDNIPYLAFRKALGLETAKSDDCSCKGKIISQIETPVLLHNIDK